MKESTNPNVYIMASVFPLLSAISLVNSSIESPNIIHICTFKVFMREENCYTFQKETVANSIKAMKEGINSAMNTKS